MKIQKPLEKELVQVYTVFSTAQTARRVRAHNKTIREEGRSLFLQTEGLKIHHHIKSELKSDFK